jgi:hypothetical protein
VAFTAVQANGHTQTAENKLKLLSSHLVLVTTTSETQQQKERQTFIYIYKICKNIDGRTQTERQIQTDVDKQTERINK